MKPKALIRSQILSTLGACCDASQFIVPRIRIISGEQQT